MLQSGTVMNPCGEDAEPILMGDIYIYIYILIAKFHGNGFIDVIHNKLIHEPPHCRHA
jgi:hypothetical protein